LLSPLKIYGGLYLAYECDGKPKTVL
jgi:hypothetical protein